MNAVEIEEAISELAEQPFDASEFPFAFLQAFGNKIATIKRLRSGSTNKSDLGGILQTNNIHILTCPEGEVGSTLSSLRESTATTKAKAKFVLATDGVDVEAEDLNSGETVACSYEDFPDHFGFFLPLAGITTVKQIRESSFDIKATGRLNRLYVELLKDNPDWGTADRRPDMNHFMARLIFCFFAEDTDIFAGDDLFTGTIEQMSERDSSNTHEVISKLFETMNTKSEDREAAGFPRWAAKLPYVNGGLFSGSTNVPRFSKIARSYLLHIGGLDWQKINPDIFGSMIQAVADDEERGSLGMHYTSVPNILKVLNPLFLDELREKLEEANDNSRKLLNLRNRIAKIRVFDPACGSGNFLVIAYKEMRAIEAEINARRGERDHRTVIPLTNFRGIELRDFPAEIARLALIIAEYQCDLLYRGQKEALAEFLPLDAMNWITCGNALQLDWLSICPPTGKGVKHHADDLFTSQLDQAQIDFENEGGETYVCGNPPYKGSQDQTPEEKQDLRRAVSSSISSTGSLDYVVGWFSKACDVLRETPARVGLVTTNSIHQGRQVAKVWPNLLGDDLEIGFARPSFKWSNLASNKAGVTVSIIGLTRKSNRKKQVFEEDLVISTDRIGPYLVPNHEVAVKERRTAISDIAPMVWGNMANDRQCLIFDKDEAKEIRKVDPSLANYIRPFYGTDELIKNSPRYCYWDPNGVAGNPEVMRERFDKVAKERAKSTRATTRDLARTPFRFGEVRQNGDEAMILVSGVSSESREYLPVDVKETGTIASNLAQMILDAELWNLALIASSLHLTWIATVCGKLETRYRYSNTLGWNTFPVPILTEKNKADLTSCAKDILLARETHHPATIADLYDPEKMPDDLRAAHERNDEVLERIYIGRRFRNDTERLEKLFELYTKMTQEEESRTTKSRKKA
ncbi:MAG: lactate dehydrogenase [Pseudomonadales bacterium]